MELWIIAIVLCILSFSVAISLALYIERKDKVRIAVTLSLVPLLMYGGLVASAPVFVSALIGLSLIQVLLFIERVSSS